MTPLEQVEIIISTLSDVSTGLPPLFTAAGLDDMESYIEDQPTDSRKKEVGCYICKDDDKTEERETAFVLQFNLKGDIRVTKYHTVIMPFLREYITAGLVDMTVRTGIEFNGWPADESGTSILWYYIGFFSQLDDCDL